MKNSHTKPTPERNFLHNALTVQVPGPNVAYFRSFSRRKTLVSSWRRNSWLHFSMGCTEKYAPDKELRWHASGHKGLDCSINCQNKNLKPKFLPNQCFFLFSPKYSFQTLIAIRINRTSIFNLKCPRHEFQNSKFQNKEATVKRNIQVAMPGALKNGVTKIFILNNS